MNYIFQPSAIPTVPVQDSDARFPVRRIFCIGRNYADHAREMGATVDRGNPVFFCKPADGIVCDGMDVPYPTVTQSLHHEVEMVLALGSGGRDLDAANATHSIFGYGVGLDLTRRDLQTAMKAGGLPWDIAKAFDHSAPVSSLRPAHLGAPATNAILALEVNGEQRQRAPIGDMIWSAAEILVELSHLFELKAGDLVFTGTPAGVAALERGDVFHARLEGIADLRGRVV